MSFTSQFFRFKISEFLPSRSTKQANRISKRASAFLASAHPFLSFFGLFFI